MKLWLLCFVVIFAAAEGLQGMSGGLNLGPAIAWHPLTILGGIGLAVISNAQALGLGSSRSPTGSHADLLKGSGQAGDRSDMGIPSLPISPPEPPLPPSPPPVKGKGRTKASQTAQATRKASPKGDSISFEIRQSSSQAKSS